MPNRFDAYGVDPDEFAGALAEAMRAGGATDDEIREELFAVHVDAQLDDGEPPWNLTREP